MHLASLLKFVKQLQRESIYPRGRHGDQGLRHQFIVTQFPSHLSVNCLPPDLKTQAIDHLNRCLGIDLDAEQKQTIQGLIKHLEQVAFNSYQWQRSQEFNQELDSIRGENYMELYD